MSTFTDWNGPQTGSNIRAGDMIQFANSYSDLVNKLQQHILSTAATDNVHNVRDYIREALLDYAKLTELSNRLTAYYTKLETDEKYATKQMLPDLSPYAKISQIPDVTPYAVKETVNTQVAELNTAIAAEIQRMNTWLQGVTNENGTLAYPDTIQAGEKLVSHLLEFTHAQLQPVRYAAYVGGSDSLGIYYLLGMLSDNNGTAYVKYQDDEQFAAVIHFAVQENEAALSVTCANNGLHWLKFYIVRTSDADGNLHYYLAAQAKEWLPTFTSTDGVGYHKTLDFESAGVNYIPIGDKHWIRPNGAGRILCDCLADTCFSATEILTRKVKTDSIETTAGEKVITKTDTGVEITNPVSGENALVASDVAVQLFGPDGKLVLNVTEAGIEFGNTELSLFNLLNRPYLLHEDGTASPFVTAEDAVQIGAISYWPKYEIDPETNIARAADFPEVYLACDGSSFNTAVYRQLAVIYPDGKLPVIDYCVIRAKELADD